jgi:bacterioferritin
MQRSERRMHMLQKIAAEVDERNKKREDEKKKDPKKNGNGQSPAQKPAQKPAGAAGGQAPNQQQGGDLMGGLQQAFEAETYAVMAYITFASCVTGTHRKYLSQFWEKEAQEELGHAKAVGEKICAMGGQPVPTSRPMPDARTTQAMIQAALQLEQEAVQHYSQLAEQAGAEGQAGIKAFLEEILVEEQHHVDDLTLMAQDYEHNDPNNVIGQQVQQNFQSFMGTAGPTRQTFPAQGQQQAPQGQQPGAQPPSPPPV